MHVGLISTDVDPWALGMRCVSAALKKGGHRTRIILMGSDKELYSSHTLGALTELVEDLDVIGISCVSRVCDRAHQVAGHLRPLHKLIVWGGIHATLNPEECAESADVVCVGEGEEMMLELLGRLEDGRDWRDLANAAYRLDGRVVMNPLRPLVSDLDTLPFYDFGCEDEFHLTRRGLARVSEVTDKTQPGQVVFVGSRGCPMGCTYCCNAKLKELYAGKGPFTRTMSVPRYVEHLKHLKQSLPGCKHFFLADDNFLARSVDEVREFSELFPRQVGIPFECCGSPLHVTEEKMGLLVDAGLWRIRMAIESASERTKREVYGRPIPNEAAVRSSRVISKYRSIVGYYFIIVGNPYEETPDLLETARFLMGLPVPFYVIVYDLVFFPGSVLYQRAVQDGLIAGKSDSGYAMDFRGGLHHKKAAWKRKNLYLNSLLYLMEGKATRHRIGALPRFLMPFLLRLEMVRLYEGRPALLGLVISIKNLIRQARTSVATLIKRSIRNPTSVYDLTRLVRARPRRV